MLNTGFKSHQEHKFMNVSRRQFLRTSTLTASAPLIANLHIDNSEASVADAVDLTMGYSASAIRMNLNENPLGPPAAAIAAAQSAIPVSNRYASPDLLVSLLADYHGIDKDWFLVGNGSTEILRNVPIPFARDPDINVVSARETWNVTPKYAATLGATVKYVKAIKKPDLRIRY